MTEWISHRGVRNNCSENSKRAFELAVESGFSWLETDLRTTRDGVIVLCHDSSLRRVFGQNTIIEEANYSDISALSSATNDALFTFEHFTKEFKDLGWVLDIKPESAGRTIDRLCSEPYRSILNSRASNKLKMLFWSSEHQHDFLARMPGIDCFARERECWQAGLAALARIPALGRIRSGKTYSLPPTLFGLSLYNSKLFSSMKSKGAKLLAYLPEQASQAQEAVNLGFDYVIANTPLFNKK